MLRACEEKPICELVDGVLVEKAVGFRESVLAAVLIKLLGVYLDTKDLGIVAGADGMLRLLPGLVRAPDVSFVSWDHLPGRKLPSRPIPDLYPDLAVEVLSRSNTPEEMDRKLKEYFSAGTRLVWYVEPEKGVVRVYTSPKDVTTLTDADELNGASLLPGFRLSIRDWFAAARSGE